MDWARSQTEDIADPWAEEGAPACALIELHGLAAPY